MLNIYRNKPYEAKKIVKTPSTLKWNLTTKKEDTKLKSLKLSLFLDLLSSLITYARSKLLEVLIPFPWKKQKNKACLCSVSLQTAIITQCFSFCLALNKIAWHKKATSSSILNVWLVSCKANVCYQYDMQKVPWLNITKRKTKLTIPNITVNSKTVTVKQKN